MSDWLAELPLPCEASRGAWWRYPSLWHRLRCRTCRRHVRGLT